MATIYLAYDPMMDRQVAIKLLLSQLTRDPQFRTRFMREAQIVASLEHPNIVPVYDFSGENSLPYLVMRYMPGGTLEDRIANKPLPQAQIVPIVQNIAGALDEAHRRGIVHRDLKPSNILFDARGYASLSDFGLAKLAERNTTKITFSGAMVGTLDYMSPEQALGEQNIDARSDVYSFGVILYEMLTGRALTANATPMKMAYMHMTGATPNVDLQRPGLPEGYTDVLNRALARKPEERFQTSGEFAAAVSKLWNGPQRPSPLRNTNGAREGETSISLPGGLESFSALTKSKTRRVEATQRARPRSRVRPWVIALVVAAVLVLGLGAALAAAVFGVLPGIQTATATVTMTATPTPTTTPTQTATLTATASPTDTETPTPTDTETPAPTETQAVQNFPTVRPPQPTPIIIAPPPTQIVLPTDTAVPPTNAPPPPPPDTPTPIPP